MKDAATLSQQEFHTVPSGNVTLSGLLWNLLDEMTKKVMRHSILFIFILFVDSLLWLCPECNFLIHRIEFKINRIDKDIESAILNFEQNNTEIECNNCHFKFSLHN